MVPPISSRISRVPPYSRTPARITLTGLSPTTACLSRQFWLSRRCHWPDPRSLATTSGVSVDVLSSGYLDGSVPRVRLVHLWIQCTIQPKLWVSPFGNLRVKCLFATNRSLSQRTTSFIASQRQGIHRMPLRHLIALIIDTHPRCSGSISQTRTRPVMFLRLCPIGRRSGAAWSCRHAGVRHSDKSSLHDVGRTAERQSRPRKRYSCARLFGFSCCRSGRQWWSQTGSNRRPPACKAGALPTELWPRRQAGDRRTDRKRSDWWAREDLNFRPHAYQACALTT